tara:strand:- start:1381 stop:1773 length:393 start_codon:yes stop_codon:yes gene_type:complete
MPKYKTQSKIRWHIGVFLAPEILIYIAVMIYPLFNTLRLALFTKVDQTLLYVGLENFRTLFGDPVWSDRFWNALGTSLWFFTIQMLVQNLIGIVLAAILSPLGCGFQVFTARQFSSQPYCFSSLSVLRGN